MCQHKKSVFQSFNLKLSNILNAQLPVNVIGMKSCCDAVSSDLFT